MKKLIIGVLVAIPVILIAVVFYVTTHLNELVVEAVETFGPPVTQTDVRLESSDISFFSGKGSLKGLTIGNPKGYQAASAFALDSLKIVLDSESVAEDVVVIDAIDVTGPEITYEPGGAAGSNLQQIVKNMEAFGAGQGGGQAASTQADAKPAKEEKSGPRVVINRVTISGGRINITTPLLQEAVEVPLPMIELTDIGREKGGIAPAEAFRKVIEKVVASAGDAVAGPLAGIQDKLKGELGKRAADLKSKAEGVAKGLPGGLGEKAGEIGDRLKSVF